MAASKAKMSQKAIKNVWASKLYSSTLKDSAVTNSVVLYFTHTNLWIQQILSYLIPIRTCWNRGSQAHFSDEKTEVEPETSLVTLWSLGNWSLFFPAVLHSMPNLSSLTRDRMHSACSGSWIPNHWTTGEVPETGILSLDSSNTPTYSYPGVSKPSPPPTNFLGWVGFKVILQQKVF